MRTLNIYAFGLLALTPLAACSSGNGSSTTTADTANAGDSQTITATHDTATTSDAVTTTSNDTGSISDAGTTTTDSHATSDTVVATDSTAATDTGSVDTGSKTDSAPASDVLSDSDASTCVTDTCPLTTGITWDCQKRFFLGINYPWQNFSCDFGGLSAWGTSGVAAASAGFNTTLASFKTNGARVIRWWMFPDFRGDGTQFDSTGTATGLGSTTVADIQEALALANANDVYIELTIFSFDGFSTTPESTNKTYPNLQAIITDTTKLQALMNNIVKPIAQAVESSPYKRRMVAWDMINEPEWAVTGNGATGDQAFSPNSSLTTVNYATMHTFIADIASTLRANSSALITVGNSAIKWKNAWTDIDQDFFTYHLYGWVQPYWPYTNTAASYGLSKPIVIGEFPFTLDTGGTTPDYTYAQVAGGLFNEGYGGAVVWETGANEAGSTIPASDLSQIGSFRSSLTSNQQCEVTLSRP